MKMKILKLIIKLLVNLQHYKHLHALIILLDCWEMLNLTIIMKE